MIKNIKFSDRQKLKILSNCIELINRGYDLKFCEAKYKRYGNILKDYLPVIKRIRNLKNKDLSDTFLKNTLNKIYNDCNIQDQCYENQNNIKIKTNRFHSILKPAILFITIMLISSFSLIGVLHASQDSLPSQPLYPVKRYVENVKLLITPEAKKKMLHAVFLKNRLNEATLFFDYNYKEKTKVDQLIEEAEEEFDQLKKYNYFGDYTEEEIKDSIEKIKEEAKNKFELEDVEGGNIEENTSNYDNPDDNVSEDSKNIQSDSEEIINEPEINNGKDSDFETNNNEKTEDDNKETEDD
ncbi:MAG: DUF5667 domain-containing protein [Candidatus Humimicrobiaceae bacterium]